MRRPLLILSLVIVTTTFADEMRTPLFTSRTSSKILDNHKANAIVFGSTGASGRQVVSKLQESSQYENIYLVSRRKISSDEMDDKFDKGSSKIHGQYVVADLTDTESLRKELRGVQDIDTAFNCLV